MKFRCSRKKGIGAKLIDLLRKISLGKFPTKLYYQGKGYKGSVATGILTIIMTLFFVEYSLVVFWEIFTMKNHSLD